MASPSVVSAVEEILSANWTHSPIVLPNEESTVPDDGSTFLTLEFPVSSEDIVTLGTLGNRIYRESGAFLITLCIPLGGGLNPTATPYHTWIDALRGVFRGHAYSNVVMGAPSSIAEFGESDKGAYFELAFSTPYEFDVIG